MMPMFFPETFECTAKNLTKIQEHDHEDWKIFIIAFNLKLNM